MTDEEADEDANFRAYARIATIKICSAEAQTIAPEIFNLIANYRGLSAIIALLQVAARIGLSGPSQITLAERAAQLTALLNFVIEDEIQHIRAQNANIN